MKFVRIIKQFIIPFILSFIVLNILGILINIPLAVIFSPWNFDPVHTIIFGFLISYLVIATFGIVKFRQHKMTVLAILIGPILLSILEYTFLYYFLIAVFSRSGY